MHEHEERRSALIVFVPMAYRSSHCRAATNVRTFEYYSFEIFTNELFFTNERSLMPVGLFLAHTLRSAASAAASRVGAMHEWHGATLAILR